MMNKVNLGNTQRYKTHKKYRTKNWM